MMAAPGRVHLLFYQEMMNGRLRAPPRIHVLRKAHECRQPASGRPELRHPAAVNDLEVKKR
jgi:hypothetical protein